ncbi:MAG: DUF1553 domain-containing protein [Candidatus Hydrogenedens sp.]|nr:DUF1553 domain-containing protein [Candidatus Hydrogenedens sp.]
MRALLDMNARAGTACVAGFLLMTMATAGASADAGLDYFTQQVQPILAEHCLKCHGGGEGRPKGGLDMMSRAALLDSGVVDLADAAASELLDMVSYRDPDHEMPPTGRLPQESIDTLAAWLAQGAPMPDQLDPAIVPKEAGSAHYNTEINDETRNWWAYRPIERPAPPEVDNPAWAKHPIDHFIFSKAADHGLTPNGLADKRALIRRATYDLTGLPPTPEEVEAFASDASPDAYPKLIDRLLDSPHYGEQWGRHWLDLVRYAETNGYERDSAKPYMWRYRDYVINAFNADKPYDRFVQEQLAGDELADGGPEGIVATGYYRLGIWDDEPVDKLQGRFDNLDGIVDTTSQVFLGITMGCARCHDHKIDPVPQADYYRMQAFFQNITEMHTTNITRSILAPGEQSAFDEAVKDHQRDIARTERRIRDLEREFAKALFEKDPAASGNAHVSDMTDVRYRFYRDTYRELPDFDNLKFEDEGRAFNDFFDLEPATRNDFFGFVFEGTLHVPEDGSYTFYLDGDDGIRLPLDGEKLAERDGLHGTGDEQSATRELTAGAHPIRLEYFQFDKGMALYAAWSGPGFERRLLSNERKLLDIPAEFAKRAGEVLGESAAKKHDFLVQKLEREKAQEVPGGKYAACVAENGPNAPDTFVHMRGNPHVEGDQVQPGFPQVLGFPDPEIAPASDSPTSRRRIALARWITDPGNPLTARVMANRLWQFHFGRGIVESSNDFGQAGILPTHPELLDWLAAELMDGGWTLKRMHRMIMLSHAYQMSSAGNEANLAKDPDNRYLWRYDMRRLTAEELRDSILAANGALNPELGGPSVYPPMPRAVLETSSRPDEAWGKSDPEDYTRRSVYIHVKRSLLHPLLQNFDFADTDSSCPVRFATVLPTQALDLMNSDFAHEQAAVFAQRLKAEADTPREQVARALELVTSRPPDEREIALGLGYMEEMENTFGRDEDAALQRLALLMFNINEFVFLD